MKKVSLKKRISDDKLCSSKRMNSIVCCNFFSDSYIIKKQQQCCKKEFPLQSYIIFKMALRSCTQWVKLSNNCYIHTHKKAIG